MVAWRLCDVQQVRSSPRYSPYCHLRGVGAVAAPGGKRHDRAERRSDRQESEHACDGALLAPRIVTRLIEALIAGNARRICPPATYRALQGRSP